MWIKICGITSLQDAETAVAAGANSIGFVFAESPRRMTPEAVREITASLPKTLEKIGVFVNASFDEMAAACRVAGLTGLQLHGSVRGFHSQHLRDSNADLTRVLQVVGYHADPKAFALDLRTLRDSSPGEEDAVLVDTWFEGKLGGMGRSFDWPAARNIFLREAPYLRLIAAGGLNPENVREAIQTLHPWGVDVSSGVEKSPGKKDSGRVAAFIRAARAAETELMETARA